MKKIIHLNAFSQCSAALQSFGQFRNPGDRTSREIPRRGSGSDLARTLEAGCFDSIFFADVHGAYDVYKGSAEAGIRHAVQFPGNDLTMLFPAMAQATRHLGFISTYSTTYYPPFHTAKLFSSLDHFTGGRVGWNIVTSYLESACRNGLGEMLPHDQRYERAEEYMEVAYKLWEASWRRARWCATTRDMHTDPPAFIRSITRANISRSRDRTCASPRRSARPCCCRPANRVAASPSARVTEALFLVYPTIEVRVRASRASERHPRAGTRPRQRKVGPGAVGNRRRDRRGGALKEQRLRSYQPRGRVRAVRRMDGHRSRAIPRRRRARPLYFGGNQVGRAMVFVGIPEPVHPYAGGGARGDEAREPDSTNRW